MRLRPHEVAALAYLASMAAGTAIAIREDEPAAFAGLGLRGESVTKDFLSGAGTAFSAPLPMLCVFATALVASRAPGRIGRRALRAVSLFGVCFAVGQAGEPVTGRALGDPGAHRLRTVVVAGNLVLPALVTINARRELRRGS